MKYNPVKVSKFGAWDVRLRMWGLGFGTWTAHPMKQGLERSLQELGSRFGRPQKLSHDWSTAGYSRKTPLLEITRCGYMLA